MSLQRKHASAWNEISVMRETLPIRKVHLLLIELFVQQYFHFQQQTTLWIRSIFCSSRKSHREVCVPASRNLRQISTPVVITSNLRITKQVCFLSNLNNSQARKNGAGGKDIYIPIAHEENEKCSQYW